MGETLLSCWPPLSRSRTASINPGDGLDAADSCRFVDHLNAGVGALKASGVATLPCSNALWASSKASWGTKEGASVMPRASHAISGGLLANGEHQFGVPQ